MNQHRIPRKLLGAWLPYARRNGNTGRPNQTIRHAYVHTLKNLGFKTNNFSEWMEIAKSRENWGKLVEYTYGLAPGTYSRTNAINKNAVLKSFENL